MRTTDSLQPSDRYPKRHYITSVDSREGSVIFDAAAPEIVRQSFSIFPLYSVRQAPAELEQDENLDQSFRQVKHEPFAADENGQPLVQFVEGVLDPLSSTGTHRSLTIDFITITQGSVILEFENGVEKIIGTGV
ncbi:uncharacterized protein N7500_007702 [Penicillium coprophilum]|uniref:uncharacterized protein n=1 Tax=Penicillium coprophilum TaxID=36646 RepID=UPI00239C6075|nr:uncharacterized protein N7500_007702 [Penicillium coprophilum]KAJ5158051.1 hypothetical protein N7500_007702 [Penicillium coprophilum]